MGGARKAHIHQSLLPFEIDELDTTLRPEFLMLPGVHSYSIIICLSLLNSVQKFTCDILRNVVTISINQALESIHPVDKDRFDYFD
jgi:hypothetical protein